MKKNSFRKLAAGIAAFALLATSVPAAQFSVSAAPGTVFSSSFDSGLETWGMYKESGGSGTLGVQDGKLALTVANRGTKTYSVQLYYDIIPLYQNGVYRLTYDISASTNRYVECMIQENGGTYQAYTWQGIDVTTTPQTIVQEFTMEEETDIMAKLCFNCGLEEADPADLPEHTIYVDNAKLELVDDSKVDYSATRPYQPNILTNQVGYRTDSQKTAVFRNANAGPFSVVNADTKQAVYTGTLSDEKANSSAGETDRIGDFSEVTTPGKYYITADGMDDSYTFEIGDAPYGNLLDDSVKMLYLQRCGTEVKDSTFGHPACHATMATIYHTNEQIEVSGGWHDAGDYGRYVVAGAKAVADLMYAYLTDPTMYSDKLGIPESGNGTADILDEVKYELDWMLKMQASSGGVYHKVTCESFPGYVMPQMETEPLIVMPISTTATADFAASMALAAEVYKDVDAAYAQKCLDAAEKAWGFLEQNGYIGYTNPEDIVTGEYGDKTDVDERYWAAAQLWRATGSDKYKTALEGMRLQEGLDWATVGDYGNIAILTMPGADTSSSAYTNAKSAVITQADKFVGWANESPYGVAAIKYAWGSNMTIANTGIIMGLAYQLTGEEKYMTGAQKQIDYLLGSNPVGTCFVTGYGTVSPQTPHHRPSMAQNTAMKGMLVGGVNSALEDSAAKAYCNGLAPALCYVDNSESYSTNEITIYWNSPLTYLLTLTNADAAETIEPTETTPNDDPTTEAQQPTETEQPSGKPLYGDVNADGVVRLQDVVVLNRSLLNIADDITPQGEINADVDLDGKLTPTDALNILCYVIDVIDELPVVDVPETYPTEPPMEAPTDAPTEQPTDAPVSGPQDTPSGIKDYGTPMNASADSIADFRTGSTSMFIASDGWTNGDPFDCGWYAQNTSLNNGCLSLSIDKDPTGQYHYSGAEYRTNDFYSYGYYETSMQAIKNDGVVSSFFTYTGPTDDNPWDEIDIEVLGKDTTKVQFNYYTNGVGDHEYMYDLGFDAAEGYHTYGFEWAPDHITWYVDGKAVHTANDNIPSTPGKIMMNTWPGTGVDDWLKPFNGNTPLTAHYQWVTYDAQ